MKLLGWMHRKLRENNMDTLKNFAIGNPCTCLSAQPLLIEHQLPKEPSYISAHSRHPKICQNSSTELKANTEEEVFDELSVMISNHFHGFLAIGTLGSESIIAEPATPKFTISYENVIEQETEVTENELKLINYELEKFLEAEAEVASNESSERSSYASTITLSGKQIDAVDDEEYENTVVCPLQGYLFGSSIELPETGVARKEKTSLGELFKKNNLSDEHYTRQTGKGEKQSKEKYATHFMKKMLKMLHSSSRSPASVTGNADDSVPTKRKLPKILRMFHRKIHPEKTTPEKKFSKSQKYEIKTNAHGGGYHNRDLTFQDNDKKRSPHAAILNKEISTLTLSNNRLSSSHSTGNGEHWIKSDADYLVLEL